MRNPMILFAEKLVVKELLFHLYLVKIKKIIIKILKRRQKKNLTYDILDTDKIIEIRQQTLKLKQYNMKKGIIWQAVIGEYFGFRDLGTGKDKSECDIISKKNQIIIELKNRTNTDNKSSRTNNLRKLAKYKKHNPSFSCIYGCVNDSSEKRTNEGKIEEVSVSYHGENYIIKKYTGKKLLELVFGKRTGHVIGFVKNVMDNNYKL